jgi:hypothetical protein
MFLIIWGNKYGNIIWTAYTNKKSNPAHFLGSELLGRGPDHGVWILRRGPKVVVGTAEQAEAYQVHEAMAFHPALCTCYHRKSSLGMHHCSLVRRKVGGAGRMAGSKARK